MKRPASYPCTIHQAVNHQVPSSVGRCDCTFTPTPMLTSTCTEMRRRPVHPCALLVAGVTGVPWRSCLFFWTGMQHKSTLQVANTMEYRAAPKTLAFCVDSLSQKERYQMLIVVGDLVAGIFFFCNPVRDYKDIFNLGHEPPVHHCWYSHYSVT